MKTYSVTWRTERGTKLDYHPRALTPMGAAEIAYRDHRLVGAREFTVIAEDGHTSLVKVGADG